MQPNNTQTLIDLLKHALALLEVSPSAPQLAYPAMVNHQGVTYLLKAPLANNYEPSMYAKMFGGSPGTHVFDPSNAPDGYALRSPAGYPLAYGIGGDGKPVGEPRVSWGDNTFANDAEIADYIARLAAAGTAGGVFGPIVK